MCGRFTQLRPWADLVRLYRAVEEAAPNWPPRYNIAPTQDVAIVCADGDGRALRRAWWGLVPSWAKEIAGPPLINARAETAGVRAAFRQALHRQRCLVPMSGFYEWQPGQGRHRQPFYFAPKDGDTAFAFAGPWDIWRSPADDTCLFSCAIVTTRANDLVRPVHDRMPVILEADGQDRWLDPASSGADVQALSSRAPNICSTPFVSMPSSTPSPTMTRAALNRWPSH